METRELTCIVCPIGCRIKVETDGGRVVSVSGNGCPRGKMYAEKECVNPERTVTTTMCTNRGTVISVKTDRPIPKDKVFETMKIINAATAELPVRIGDVLVADVFGSNVVATVNVD